MAKGWGRKGHSGYWAGQSAAAYARILGHATRQVQHVGTVGLQDQRKPFSAAAAMLLGISGWFEAELVYRHKVAVSRN
ncbi:hypothetical protein AB3R30_16925 [Leptolyngbyaceae cyanobacterium UHCC 1019]